MDSATVALVTGANKGIGKEVAKQLLGKKMVVFVAARDVTKGRATAAEIGADFVQLDVTDASSVEQAMTVIAERYGRLDVLVNNAGVATEYEPVLTAKIETCKEIFDANVFGAVRVLQAAQGLLKSSSKARVVNVSSELGSLQNNGDPDFEFAQVKPLGYNASKAALNMVTVLASDALPAAKVNSACPGYTATELNGNSGYRTVDQAATVIVDLATLPDDGPSGKFFNDKGPIPW